MKEPKIVIVDYDPSWQETYQKEKQLILEVIGDYVLVIEHVGSTSIPYMAAKPVIDILVGVKTLRDAVHCIPKLEELGYEYLPGIESHVPNRRFFRKPPGEGKRTFQLHMKKYQGENWETQILFREYLRKHTETAREYEQMKKYMVKRFPNNEVAYGIGKEGFIFVILQRAKKEKKQKK